MWVRSSLDRLVEQAIARFMPETAEANAEKAAEDRHVTFHHHQLSLNGTTFVQAELDLADALDLDAAITAEAEALRLAGSADSLDVRRAIAAGRLARRQLGLPLETTEPEDGKRGATGGRQVVLYVHLSEAAITGGTGGLELAQVNNHHRTVLADQVRTWCQTPEATVIVKPVLDVDEHIGVAGYEVPARLAEQAEVRDGTCTFPWCTRPAISCDIDHVIAHRPVAPPAPATPHPCAVATTGSRPTLRGPTPSSTPAPICGPARTATSSSATDTAPPTSRVTGHRREHLIHRWADGSVRSGEQWAPPDPGLHGPSIWS